MRRDLSDGERDVIREAERDARECEEALAREAEAEDRSPIEFDRERFAAILRAIEAANAAAEGGDDGDLIADEIPW
jgi:hypothetical protein